MAVDTSTPFQYASDAGVALRDESVTMIEGLITQGQQHTTSHIGLAEDSILLQSLKDAGSIGAKSWGLNVGSQSYLFPRDGSLVLGGYDQASVDGPFFSYNIAHPNMLNRRPCPLQIMVTQMTLKVQNANLTSEKDYIDVSNKLQVCIEP
jgi:hypothetical protein